MLLDIILNRSWTNIYIKHFCFGSHFVWAELNNLRLFLCTKGRFLSKYCSQICLNLSANYSSFAEIVRPPRGCGIGTCMTLGAASIPVLAWPAYWSNPCFDPTHSFFVDHWHIFFFLRQVQTWRNRLGSWGRVLPGRPAWHFKAQPHENRFPSTHTGTTGLGAWTEEKVRNLRVSSYISRILPSENASVLWSHKAWINPSA